LGVLDLDWGALRRSLPSAASPKFVELARSGGDSEAPDEGAQDLRRLLAELPEEELQLAVIDMLKVEIGDILRMAPDKIDATLSVQQMGLDSLMGVELVVAVENRFGTRLPVMALSDSPTLAKLAVWIIAQLRGEEASTDARHDETRAQIEMVASQHAADVPVAEIERIAASLRADGSGASRRMIH
jgi:acyl carrier protein